MDNTRRPELPLEADSAENLNLAIRDVARHIAMADGARSFRFMRYAEDGNVAIPLLDSWREERHLPGFVAHMQTPGNEPFPEQFDDRKSGALCFWLDPHIVHDNGRMNGPLGMADKRFIRDQAKAFCEALQDKLLFTDLRHRVFFPNETLQKQLGDRACAALVLGCPPREYASLSKLPKELKAQRKHAPLAEPGSELDHSRCWSHRFTPSHIDALSLAMQGIAGQCCAYPQILPVHENFLALTPPARAGRPSSLEQAMIADLKQEGRASSVQTHALVLWLRPDYRVPQHHFYHVGPSNAPEHTEAIEMQNEELENFVLALEQQVGSELSYKFAEPAQPDGPAALIIHSDSPDQVAKLERLETILEPLIARQLSAERNFRNR